MRCVKRKTVTAAIAVAALGTIAAFWLVSDRRTFIDGYPVGEHVCPQPNPSWWCDAGTAYANAALDNAKPGHAPVTSVEVFDANYRAADGSRLTRTYGTAGADGVFVLRLADGSAEASYLACLAGPWGPRESPSPEEVRCGVALPYEH